MRRTLLSISVICIGFCSCDKNKEMVRYMELYHIEGSDTISAIYIPNSFTPDGDGQNDSYKTIEYGIVSDGFILEIYNENGMLIFQTYQLNQDWDGTYRSLMAPSGTYTVKIVAEDSTGYRFENTNQFERMR